MNTTSSAIQRFGSLMAAGLLVCLLAAAVLMQLAMERQRPKAARTAALSYLPKGEYLKLAVLGYRQLAADIIWLQVVQQFGKRSDTTEGYRWTYHAVDVITDLDPKFVYAYQAAGTILGVWAGQISESIAILKKGMQHNPTVWQLPFFVGYDYYFELCNPGEAAEYFRLASALPEAPAHLPGLAARMTVEAGDPEAALEFLYRLYDQVQDDRLKEGLDRRIKDVLAERDIRFLENAVHEFKRRYGRLPKRMTELVSSRIINSIPPEPHGGVYELGPTGGINSTGLQERLQVHRRTTCAGTGQSSSL